MRAAHFLATMAAPNTARRQLGVVFTRCDVWLTPTTPRVAEPWGRYNLGRDDVDFEHLAEVVLAPICQ